MNETHDPDWIEIPIPDECLPEDEDDPRQDSDPEAVWEEEVLP